MDDTSKQETARYVSPDGVLKFLVVRGGGDVTLGFEDTPAHTHADILAALSGLSPDEAVSQYVDALLENKSVVAIATVNGQVRDIWISDEPTKAACINNRANQVGRGRKV